MKTAMPRGGVVLQVMELGEPDASEEEDRSVEGKTETIAIDTMILAIGQAVDASIFDCDKTRKNAIAYDKDVHDQHAWRIRRRRLR